MFVATINALRVGFFLDWRFFVLGQGQFVALSPGKPC
jgi:hypothetical protein